MFYIYIISSTIVALLLIVITYFIPLFLIREFDKITYIKNYKEAMKWYKQPLYYIREILTYITLLFSLMIFAIFGLSNPIMKKQFKEVFRRMFVTPLVGIGFSILIALGIYKVLHSLEGYVLMGTFVLMYFIVIYIIIPYYIVLIVKQLINLIKMENSQLEDYKELKEEGFKKKDWVAAILLSSRKEEYIDNYLQVYDTEEEWKESKFVLINYINMHKFICTLALVTILLNFVLSFINYDILNNNIQEIELKIGSPILIPYIVLVVGVIALGLLITLLLNWIFNSKILSFSTIKEIKREKKLIKKTILLNTIPMILIIVISILSIQYNSQFTEYLKPYEEQKENFVDFMLHKKDYLDYNSYEKQQYIFAYSQDFIDDIDELEYTTNEQYKAFCMPTENNELINYFNLNEEEGNTLYISNHEISISNLDCDEPLEESRIFINSNEEFYTYNSEQKAKEYEEIYLGSYKNLTDREIEKIMKEEAIKGIDKLWSEEMKDRGLE